MFMAVSVIPEVRCVPVVNSFSPQPRFLDRAARHVELGQLNWRLTPRMATSSVTDCRNVIVIAGLCPC